MADKPTYDELVTRVVALERHFDNKNDLVLASIPLAALQRKLEQDWSPDTSWFSQNTRLRGPFTSGAITVPAASGYSIDVPVPDECHKAGRVVIGMPDGTSGAYEWITFGATQGQVVTGRIRIYFKNHHPTIAANFTFNFLIYVGG